MLPNMAHRQSRVMSGETLSLAVSIDLTEVMSAGPSVLHSIQHSINS